MGHQPRATVVPFPAGPRSGGRQQAGGTGSQAVVLRPWGDRDADARRNEGWDELLRLVNQAWSWRDPETLRELDACLLHLGIAVETDWS